MLIVLTLLLCYVVFILFGLLMDKWFGEIPEKNYLGKYYKHLKGEVYKRRTFTDRILRLSKEQRYYVLNTKKYLMYTLPICICIFLFMLFFFRSFSFAFVISLAGFLYPRIIILGIIKKRRRLLNNQLKEAMFSMVSSLRAGASLQTAIERCVLDLKNIFHNEKDAPIIREFDQMSKELQMGYTVDEVLYAFRERVYLEDVTDFVNATLIAKKRGGNLTEILINISKVISEKIEISNEIQVLTAGKQMEAKMLSLMPVFIVGCLTILSPEYMEAMYDSWIGKLLLFIGFIFIIINYFISRKIVDIHV
ncbi:type II secretion system F family protein [Paenibacillus oryzisoli]|uniref:Type II secretion system protein GspF domain-containing protein n=1 Tax=Paenibacillus oryzisoli TaxID=1850517 RepID=A0A198A3I0_9BACL|nr:type II secretion system F family protein [Paenibacillus oryzisoli]OAS16039.1 hypothetical protein A8708_05525 [Paenibacillus oryzisoli]